MCIFCVSLLTSNWSHASVTGTIHDATGIPVEGVFITFTDKSNAKNVFSAYTDKSGKYDVFLWDVNVDVDENPSAPISLGQN